MDRCYQGELAHQEELYNDGDYFCFDDTIVKIKELPNPEREVISNSNWTEWSTIQRVIARVISKSDEREAPGRFEITSTSVALFLSFENCIRYC